MMQNSIFAEFIVGWLGGEPNSVDLDNPEYNNSVTDGVTMLRPAGETPLANGIDFVLSAVNAGLGATDKYFVDICLYQTADGKNVAVINLTSSDYNTWRQTITSAPVYKDAILPDGRAGVLQIQYDQARADNPYVASIGVDSNGMLVAQPHVYAGDTVTAGSEDIFGNFTPYTVPLSTYNPNAPEAILNTPTPWNVTVDYLRPETLIY